MVEAEKLISALRLQVVDEEQNYNCPDCKDQGFVPASAEPGAPWRKCRCRIIQEQRYKYQCLVSEARLAELQHMTFESYKPATASQKRALQAISAGHGSYYLFGPWGAGKTHLMAASAFRAIRQGIESVLISVPRLLDVIRKTGREADADIFSLAMSIPYLCLDDIGKQKDSDWTEERLFILIDERSKLQQHAGKCHTSITSQYTPDMLAKKMDGAIVSRIRGMCKALLVEGADMRGVNG